MCAWSIIDLGAKSSIYLNPYEEAGPQIDIVCPRCGKDELRLITTREQSEKLKYVLVTRNHADFAQCLLHIHTGNRVSEVSSTKKVICKRCHFEWPTMEDFLKEAKDKIGKPIYKG